MFFKHFASKNQLPGFYINETLIENGSIKANISYGKNRGKGIFLSGGRGGGGEYFLKMGVISEDFQKIHFCFMLSRSVFVYTLQRKNVFILII